jgi:hypothetical protein
MAGCSHSAMRASRLEKTSGFTRMTMSAEAG